MVSVFELGGDGRVWGIITIMNIPWAGYSKLLVSEYTEVVASVDNVILYSWKYWRGIKFGGLAVCEQTTKLKSANFEFFRRFSRNPPNIIPANISGYTVCQYKFISYMYCLCILLHCLASGDNWCCM